MGSGVEGITQSGVSTPKALPKIPVLKIHSLPTIHCYYYLDISSNIPALSGLYVLRSRFLKALTLSIFPYHVLSTHWWICSMHTLLGDGWIAITLLLDGHDTRATYGENKVDMFSYKLRKPGLRTQVCMYPSLHHVETTMMGLCYWL